MWPRTAFGLARVSRTTTNCRAILKKAWPMVKESKDRMTEIANACLLEGHHSTHCRRALVVVIPKHGRDDNSLQSTASRIREYLAEGIRESRCAILVDVMRACHQIFFVLFSLGLCAYFLSTDMTTFGIVSSWFFVWSVLYIWMTMTAISRHISPYRSPLSSIFYRFAQLTRFARSITPDTFTGRSTRFAASNSHRGLLRRLSPEGMRETMEESVQKFSEDLDSRILGWTFNSLTQDHEFEQFFAGIPDFCLSRAVRDPKDLLLELNDKQESLSRMLFVWISRTVTSHLISEPARQ